MPTKPTIPKTPFTENPGWLKSRDFPVNPFTAREKCQSVVSESEKRVGLALITEFREHEKAAAAHDIESRQHQLERLKGHPAEMLRREIAACDHCKWETATTSMDEIRKKSFTLIEPVFARLMQTLDEQLASAATAVEKTLAEHGIPLKQGEAWTLHSDPVIKSLWCQRIVAKSTFDALAEHKDGVGAVQFFCSDEPGVPFSWV